LSIIHFFLAQDPKGIWKKNGQLVAPDVSTGNDSQLKKKQWWQVDQPLLENWPHPIKTRTDIGKMFNLLNLKREIEVGVQRGRIAMRTLSEWKSYETYKLVDLWGVDPNYKEPRRDNNAVKNQHMQAAKDILTKWTEKGITEFSPMRSNDAVKLSLTTILILCTLMPGMTIVQYWKT
jgi:hypothetical protein